MRACGKEEIVKCLYVCKEAKQKEEAMTLEIGQDKDNRYKFLEFRFTASQKKIHPLVTKPYVNEVTLTEHNL